MLIRDINGNIVNIKRGDFITDSDYYKQISLFYGVKLNNINNITRDNVYNYEGNYNIKNQSSSKEKILDMLKMM